MPVTPPITIPPANLPSQVQVPTNGTLGSGTTGGSLDANMKGCLGFLTALVVVGAAAELLYNVSPKAAYAFVAVVIMGYAMTGGNLDQVTGFFNSIIKSTGGQ